MRHLQIACWRITSQNHSRELFLRRIVRPYTVGDCLGAISVDQYIPHPQSPLTTQNCTRAPSSCANPLPPFQNAPVCNIEYETAETRLTEVLAGPQSDVSNPKENCTPTSSPKKRKLKFHPISPCSAVKRLIKRAIEKLQPSCHFPSCSIATSSHASSTMSNSTDNAPTNGNDIPQPDANFYAVSVEGKELEHGEHSYPKTMSLMNHPLGIYLNPTMTKTTI